MDTRYLQIITSYFYTMTKNRERSVTIFIIGNIPCLIICILFQTIGDHIAGKVADDLFVSGRVCINDQSSVSRKKLGKTAEGMTDIINILKKVQMIGIYVQDNTYFWKKAQEAVGIFAGFCDKGFRFAYTDIASDGRENAAHTDGRIAVSLQENVGYHGSGGCFTVSSGNGNGSFVIAHDLSQKFCTGKHWQSLLYCAGIFRIIRMNGSSVNYQFYLVTDIGSALTVVNSSTFFLQCLGQRAGLGIGT